MARHQPSVSIDLVHLLLRYASVHNIQLPKGLETFNLTPTVLTHAGSRISADQFNALWRAIVSASGDPDFGLHFGAALRTPPEGSILFAVMLNCHSVGDVLAKLARYHGLVTNLIRLQLTRTNDSVLYRLETAGPEVLLDRHYVEAMLGGQVLTLRYLTENRVSAREVRFRHTAPPSLWEQELVFQCPLRFDQPNNALVLQTGDLDIPIFLANPALLSRLETLAQELLSQIDIAAPWTEQVGHLLSKRLLSGEKTSLDIVASELALSPRHVQNKLRAEGTSYRTLLEQLRQETALRFLRDPTVTLCDIAFLLGFSDQSAFTNAFKRWTGSSPNTYRRTHLLLPGDPIS